MMVNKKNTADDTLNRLDEILMIYQTILQNPSFQMYEEYEDRLDQLYKEVNGQFVDSDERGKLEQVLGLHQRIIQFILNEKEMLSQDIIMLEKKKQATNYYGKLSNSYDVGAFFVDLKSK